jgi:hypothetical protein
MTAGCGGQTNGLVEVNQEVRCWSRVKGQAYREIGYASNDPDRQILRFLPVHLRKKGRSGRSCEVSSGEDP